MQWRCYRVLNSDDFYAGSNVICKIAECFSDGVDAAYGDLVYVDQDNVDLIIRL